jgi:hypothetical protein
MKQTTQPKRKEPRLMTIRTLLRLRMAQLKPRSPAPAKTAQ